jgi:hypothetical protein
VAATYQAFFGNMVRSFRAAVSGQEPDPGRERATASNPYTESDSVY